jgi:hypothetical protein
MQLTALAAAAAVMTPANAVVISIYELPQVLSCSPLMLVNVPS